MSAVSKKRMPSSSAASTERVAHRRPPLASSEPSRLHPMPSAEVRMPEPPSERSSIIDGSCAAVGREIVEREALLARLDADDAEHGHAQPRRRLVGREKAVEQVVG